MLTVFPAAKQMTSCLIGESGQYIILVSIYFTLYLAQVLGVILYILCRHLYVISVKFLVVIK